VHLKSVLIRGVAFGGRGIIKSLKRKTKIT
jgi:hypothetical protein